MEGADDGRRELVVNPTAEQLNVSSLDLLIAGTSEAVLMIEGFCDFLPEETLIEVTRVTRVTRAMRVTCITRVTCIMRVTCITRVLCVASSGDAHRGDARSACNA